MDLPALSVYLLGHFRVRREGEPLALGRKVPWRPLQLLQAIAVLGPREANCASVVAALWPDAEGDAAARAFEITLHRLRRLLGDPHAVSLSHGHVGLDERRVWVDVEAFEALAESVERRDDLAGVDEAMGLYGGGLLAHEEDSAWLLPVRARLRSRFLRLVTRGAFLLEAAGRPDDALDLLHRGLEREPMAEALHGRLVAALDALGRPAEAREASRESDQLLRVLGTGDPAIRAGAGGAVPARSRRRP